MFCIRHNQKGLGRALTMDIDDISPALFHPSPHLNSIWMHLLQESDLTMRVSLGLLPRFLNKPFIWDRNTFFICLSSKTQGQSVVWLCFKNSFKKKHFPHDQEDIHLYTTFFWVGRNLSSDLSYQWGIWMHLSWKGAIGLLSYWIEGGECNAAEDLWGMAGLDVFLALCHC